MPFATTTMEDEIRVGLLCDARSDFRAVVNEKVCNAYALSLPVPRALFIIAFGD